jgi:hypothetical protein
MLVYAACGRIDVLRRRTMPAPGASLFNLLLTLTGFGAAILETARWYRGTDVVPAGA